MANDDDLGIQWEDDDLGISWEKTNPGESPENPLQEQGVSTDERRLAQNLGSDPQQIIDWLQREPGTGGKPKEFSAARMGWEGFPGVTKYFNPMGAAVAPALAAGGGALKDWLFGKTPLKQYEAQQYKPEGFINKNYISLREKGTQGPFKVLDPERAEWEDVIDLGSTLAPMVLPATGPVTTAAAKLAPALMGTEYANIGASRNVGLDVSPEEERKRIALAGASGIAAPIAGEVIARAPGALSTIAGKALQLPYKAELGMRSGMEKVLDKASGRTSQLAKEEAKRAAKRESMFSQDEARRQAREATKVETKAAKADEARLGAEVSYRQGGARQKIKDLRAEDKALAEQEKGLSRELRNLNPEDDEVEIAGITRQLEDTRVQRESLKEEIRELDAGVMDLSQQLKASKLNTAERKFEDAMKEAGVPRISTKESAAWKTPEEAEAALKATEDAFIKNAEKIPEPEIPKDATSDVLKAALEVGKEIKNARIESIRQHKAINSEWAEKRSLIWEMFHDQGEGGVRAIDWETAKEMQRIAADDAYAAHEALAGEIEDKLIELTSRHYAHLSTIPGGLKAPTLEELASFSEKSKAAAPRGRSLREVAEMAQGNTGAMKEAVEEAVSNNPHIKTLSLAGSYSIPAAAAAGAFGIPAGAAFGGAASILVGVRLGAAAGVGLEALPGALTKLKNFAPPRVSKLIDDTLKARTGGPAQFRRALGTLSSNEAFRSFAEMIEPSEPKKSNRMKAPR